MGRAGTSTDLVFGFSQAEWTAVGAAAQGGAAIVAAVALCVATWQIIASRAENKRARTIAVCERYDLDPFLNESIQVLRKARIDGSLYKWPYTYVSQVHTLINFFDQLAIGARKGAYKDRTLYQFMRHIVTFHHDSLIESGVAEKLEWKPEHYEAFDRMARRWKKRMGVCSAPKNACAIKENNP